MTTRPARPVRSRGPRCTRCSVAVLIVVLFGVSPTWFGAAPGGPIDVGFFVFLFAGLWLYWALGSSSSCVRMATPSAGCSRLPPRLTGLGLCLLRARLRADDWGCHPTRRAAGSTSLAPLLFNPAIILLLPAVAIVFPTGALPGPRWRGPVAVVVALVVVRSVPSSSRPGPMGDDGPMNPLTPGSPRCRGRRGPLSRSSTHRQPVHPHRRRVGVAALLVRVTPLPGRSSASSSSGCSSPWCPRRSCSRSACSRTSRPPFR